MRKEVIRMLALTYISKAQYRQINESSKSMSIQDMRDAYGVGYMAKLHQYIIVDILESAWKSYKSTHDRHAPKDSDEFFDWITGEKFNVNGEGLRTLWEYGLMLANNALKGYNDKHPDKPVGLVEDNTLTQALLYTHIKAKIGDWDD